MKILSSIGRIIDTSCGLNCHVFLVCCVYYKINREPHKGRTGNGFAKTILLKDCPGAVDNATLPLKRGSAIIKCFRGERMGFSPWGYLAWRGRLGRGDPRGETKAGEERYGL